MQKRKVSGLVNLYDAPDLGVLTETRNFGAVTFLGRYGLLDFILSNYSNSGIDRVGILVKDKAFTVRSHIQNGSAFTINTKLGRLVVIHDEKGILNPSTNTCISALISNRDNIVDNVTEYIVFAPAKILMSFDFRELIEDHIQSGADVTIMYQHRNDLDKTLKGNNIFTIKNDKIKNLKRNDMKNAEGDISLGIYVFNRTYFEYLALSQKNVSLKYDFSDMLKYDVKNNKPNYHLYEYKGLNFPISSLDDYIKASFDLLDNETRRTLFRDDWPIYTAAHNTPPAKYGPKANVKNSFIANGAIINGTVENSVISRHVVIENGATVKNSIIFTGSEIGEKTSLNYVLSDKHVHIQKGTKLSGDKKYFYTIRRGENI